MIDSFSGKIYKIFIQARMSSKRFPGKVLAPFNGVPIIKCVIDRILNVVPIGQVVVLTSQEESDEPLACYLDQLGVATFRGPLDNVFTRFKKCLEEYPCEWFVRLCADSPLLDYEPLKSMLTLTEKKGLDLVTNVFPRTYPKGQSIEIVRAKTFKHIDNDILSPLQQEHVTKVYYDQSDQYQIFNVESTGENRSGLNYSVDTIEDLYKLQEIYNLI